MQKEVTQPKKIRVRKERTPSLVKNTKRGKHIEGGEGEHTNKEQSQNGTSLGVEMEPRRIY